MKTGWFIGHRYLAEFDFRYSNRIKFGIDDVECTETRDQGRRRQAGHLSNACCRKGDSIISQLASVNPRSGRCRNLWDAQPLPVVGDEDPKLTFQGVGMVMTAWESVEFELSRLYSVFASDADGESMRVYGEGKIFRDRINALRGISQKTFTASPNQNKEGCFAFIANSIEGFSQRRNEVAHGIVFPIHTLTVFRSRLPRSEQERNHFALVPPYYLGRKHDAATGVPAFVYTSSELKSLSMRLYKSLDKIKAFRKSLASPGLP